MEKDNYSKKYFKRISFVGLIQVITNFLLSLIKLIGGMIGKSSSLISDAVDSLGDFFTSFLALMFNKKANKKPDKEHQFGHLKIENIISLTLSIFIFISAIYLIYKGISSLINKEYLSLENDKLVLILLVASISLLIKLALAIFTYIEAKRIDSSLLKAEATDHALDSIGTLITLISYIFIFIFKSEENIKILDPIASIAISLIIAYGAIKIYLENASSLLDKAVSKNDEEFIKDLVLKEEGVLHIDALRTILSSSFIFIELEITVKDDLSLKEAHEIAEKIRINLLNSNERIKSILVHVNPESHKNEETL